jgi:hypothetical protein
MPSDLMGRTKRRGSLHGDDTRPEKLGRHPNRAPHDTPESAPHKRGSTDHRSPSPAHLGAASILLARTPPGAGEPTPRHPHARCPADPATRRPRNRRKHPALELAPSSELLRTPQAPDTRRARRRGDTRIEHDVDGWLHPGVATETEPMRHTNRATVVAPTQPEQAADSERPRGPSPPASFEIGSALGCCHTVHRVNAPQRHENTESELPAWTCTRNPAASQTVLGRLPWGFVPFDAYRSEQRPTPGLPHPAVLRLQAFSTS